MEGKRVYKVLFKDGTRREFTADNVPLIYVKSLYYILGLNKPTQVEAIIDEPNAKLYTDFDWDLSYSQKNLDYLVTGPRTYTALDVERMVLSYARHLGNSVDHALAWLETQQI